MIEVFQYRDRGYGKTNAQRLKFVPQPGLDYEELDDLTYKTLEDEGQATSAGTIFTATEAAPRELLYYSPTST